MPLFSCTACRALSVASVLLGLLLPVSLGHLAASIAGARPEAVQVPSDLTSRVDAFVASNQKRIVAELIELLRLPNVAADTRNIRRNAEHLRGMLAARGFAAEVLETGGNPLVYGELTVPGAVRTLLIYCHYDGQPVDAGGWNQPDPFTPVLRTDRIDAGGREIDLASAARLEPGYRLYARSASDDKSPIVAVLAALDALKAAGVTPTSNIRMILDGEEEAGSVSLVPAIARYRDKLAADLMLIFDGPIHSSGRPTVAFGARGILTLDLTVFGPKSGVHSGNYGNWVPNPAMRLAQLLASMKDDEGRVLVEGFYDAVPAPAGEDRAMLESVPEDAARMLRTFGIAAPERSVSSLQQALNLPTLNVRGLVSAHVGRGARTIVPDSATAAIDVRLVRETRGEAMLEKIRAHVRRQGYVLVDGEPDDELRARHDRIARIAWRAPTEAFRTPASDPGARLVVAALTRMAGAPPVQLRTLGGTVPIAPFIEGLGFPALIVPTVNFDNNQHEENENLRLGNLFAAIGIAAAIFTM
jgi:acetylornithine deacetylase/succinyl-diaminopimelate desuccinylase-like protein